MELGPRNGGSYISQLIKYATGVDLVKYTIKGALSRDCSDLKMAETIGCYSNYMILSAKSGKFKSLIFDKDFEKNNLLEVHCMAKGDSVSAYRNTSHSLGTILFKANDLEEMEKITGSMEKYCQVEVE